MTRFLACIILLLPVLGLAETIAITVTGPTQQLNVVKESVTVAPESRTVNVTIDATGTEVVTVGVPGPQGPPGTGGSGSTDISGLATKIHFTEYSTARAADEAADLKLTYDQFMALNGASFPSATNPFATVDDITAAGYTSNYVFCEDDQSGTVPTTTINSITRVWHELERLSDGGAVGQHTATGTAYTEMDRYVTAALNTTIVPGGTWKFTLYANLNAVQKEGTLKADIYRIGSNGAVISLLGTATTPAFTNTAILPIQASIYISQQTGWNATDRIGVVISGKRGAEGGATVTFYHNAAAGHASIMETPVTLLHNQMQGLNEGNYQHLSAAEKTLADALLDGVSAGEVSYGASTVSAALDSLLYVPISISSYTMNGSGSVTQEIGSSFTVNSLAWATNKTTFTSTINSVSRTSPYSVGATVSSNTIYSLAVTDGTSSATSSRSVTFTHKRYWGVNAAATLTDADIIALSSEYSTSRSQSRTLSPSAQYMYIVYTADGGDATFTVNGFLDTSWVLVTRDFVNSSGWSSSFRIYRSANPLTGTYSVVVS